MPMKVAIYARVSTKDKDQNPETQLRILREYVLAHGWEVFGEPYVDEGFSGKNTDRPAFKRLLEDAHAHRFQAIVMLRMDRFMRSTRHALNVAEEMKDLGIDLVFTAQAIDTTTAQGKLFFTITSGFAEYERGIISERVSEGIQRKLAQGGKWGKGRRKDVNVELAKMLLETGKARTVSDAARQLGVPRSTLLDHARRRGINLDGLPTCESSRGP